MYTERFQNKGVAPDDDVERKYFHQKKSLIQWHKHVLNEPIKLQDQKIRTSIA